MNSQDTLNKTIANHAIVTTTSANLKCVTFHSGLFPRFSRRNSHTASPVDAFSSVTHFTVADEGGSYA
jgi:hypothetical protein